MSDSDNHPTLKDLDDTLSRIMLLVEEVQMQLSGTRKFTTAIHLGQRPCPTCGTPFREPGVTGS